MNEEVVRVERRERIAVVTLTREARANALSRELVLALGRVGRELKADDTLCAVVLTGSGQKAFCAGADLKERQGMSAESVRGQLQLYESELHWLRRSPVPTVAAINGVALGGGLELALLCDLRVAAEHAVLGLPETGLGIIPGSGGTQLLPRLIGEARAKELILRGSRVSAPEALALGLVNRVSGPTTHVLDDTLEWLRPIADGAPIAQRAALRAVRAALEMPLDAGLEHERALYEQCLQSEDREEALRAFAEKRPPRFTGR
ncbi:MAG TPA: enoyl-CoA hydratase-related protein [Polyangiaceae bacterium]|nr:enoyl-CoA hydratase-related protein [Polyangiaceae bacterium]